VGHDLRRDQLDLVEVVQVEDLEVHPGRAQRGVPADRVDDLRGGAGEGVRAQVVDRAADELRAPLELGPVRSAADGVRVGVGQLVGVAADLLARACEEIGRDPDELAYSNAHTVCCASDRAELERRAEFIGRSVDDLRTNALAGTPAEIVDTIGRYAALGATRMYLQVLDLHDLDQIQLIASEVMPHV